MFRPVIQKNRTLIFMAVLNLLLVYWVFNSTVVERSNNYNEKLAAAKIMKTALSVLKNHVEASDMQIFRSIDPN